MVLELPCTSHIEQDFTLFVLKQAKAGLIESRANMEEDFFF